MTREPGTWLITWDGREWSENDLCGAHAALVTILAGNDAWASLDPFKGPMTLMQIIAAFVSIADQRDAMEVLGELGRAPIMMLLEALTTVE